MFLSLYLCTLYNLAAHLSEIRQKICMKFLRVNFVQTNNETYPRIDRSFHVVSQTPGVEPALVPNYMLTRFFPHVFLLPFPDTIIFHARSCGHCFHFADDLLSSWCLDSWHRVELSERLGRVTMVEHCAQNFYGRHI